MFIISQPCSLELCLYKVKRGNFGITVQKYPHTQQHIIHKAPRLYITKIYLNSTWSVKALSKFRKSPISKQQLDNTLDAPRTIYILKCYIYRRAALRIICC